MRMMPCGAPAAQPAPSPASPSREGSVTTSPANAAWRARARSPTQSAGQSPRADDRAHARGRLHPDRPHQHDRIRLFRHRRQSALRHAASPWDALGAAFPAAARRARPLRSPTEWRRSRSAATPAARAAFQPPSAASSATSRRRDGCRWRRHPAVAEPGFARAARRQRLLLRHRRRRAGGRDAGIARGAASVGPAPGDSRRRSFVTAWTDGLRRLRQRGAD
jgi:hypothetical protein